MPGVFISRGALHLGYWERVPRPLYLTAHNQVSFGRKKGKVKEAVLGNT